MATYNNMVGRTEAAALIRPEEANEIIANVSEKSTFFEDGAQASQYGKFRPRIPGSDD